MAYQDERNVRKCVCRNGSAKLLLILAGIVAVPAGRAWAADRFWVGTSGGDWFDQSMWAVSLLDFPPASVPGIGDVARFEVGGRSYTITFVDLVNVKAVKVASDFVTFDLQGRSLTTSQLLHVGTVLNDIGSLTLRGGEITSPDALVGFNQGDGRVVVESDATLTVDGSLSSIAFPLSVGGLPLGSQGLGLMDIAGTVNVLSADSVVGGSLRGDGTVNVTGGTWTTDESLIIGRDGATGLVSISDGGVAIIKQNTFVGQSGRTNTFVDVTGIGRLNITNGTLRSLQNATIGSAENSFGDADLVGTQSAWDVGGSLLVAEFGIGNLTLRNSANMHVQNDSFISVGANEGLLNVTGFGSLVNDGSLFVGGSSSSAGGPGHLLVQSNGTVEVGGLLKVWETGTLTINDGTITTNSFTVRPGATLNFRSGRLIINGGPFNVPVNFEFDGPNSFDPPHIILRNGAVASAIDFSLGINPGTFSAFELNDSSLNATDDINIGGNDVQPRGGGSLDLTGSNLFAGDRLQVWPEGAVSVADSDVFVHQLDITGGKLSMSGAGSSMLVDAGGGFGLITGIHIGTSSTFSHATISGGGSLNAPGIQFNVGSGPGSDAQVNLTDSGSKLSVGTARIASGGSGTLVVENQSQVVFGGDLTLANASGVFGTLLVDGPASKMTCNGTMTVARRGDAIFQVSAGASAHTLGDTEVGSIDASGGFVLVTGGGANWTSDGSIYVGGDDLAQHGSGELDVRAGATVDNAGALRIWPTGKLTMKGGLLHTHDLLAETGTLDLQGGTIQVVGGQFSLASSLVFGGADPNNPVSFEFLDGAAAQVTFAWHIGRNPGTFGETTVSGVSAGGVRSTLHGTRGGAGADLEVGREGNGTMRVLDGALVDFGDDVFVAHLANSVGRLDVSGVAGGFRSTVLATRGSGPGIAIAQLGNGTLNVSDGGLVESALDMSIAAFVGAIGELTLSGRNGLVGEVRVGDDLFVAGSATAFGGRGDILVSGGGLLVVNDVLKVWPDGFVDLDGGTIRAGHLDLTDTEPGSFNFITGRIAADRITGDLDNFEGTLAPGAATIAAMTLDGNYHQFNTAEIEIELAGTTPGTEYDVANITGIATLDGTLHVLMDPGFTPAGGERFTVLTYAAHFGEFSDIVVEGTTLFDAVYGANQLQLVAQGAPAIPGDFNGDGVITVEDYASFNLCITGPDAALGLQPSCDLADIDQDGDVDSRDFALLQSAFGN